MSSRTKQARPVKFHEQAEMDSKYLALLCLLALLKPMWGLPGKRNAICYLKFIIETFG